jgi:hypothetical protein
MFVTGSYDKTARLSLLQVNDLVDRARTILGRNFLLKNGNFIFQARSTTRPHLRNLRLILVTRDLVV